MGFPIPVRAEPRGILGMHKKAIAARVSLTVAPMLLGFATVASAAEPPPPPSETQAKDQQSPPPQSTGEQPAAKKKWEFATIGYVWFAGAWGKTDVIGPVEP